MIRSFTVTNPSNESLTMELENPKKSGFFVAGITGLGPPKADINTTRKAGSDGSVHNSSKVESRNIVITLIYYTDNENQYSVEDLRHLTYKYFPIKKNVTLYFRTDTRRASITGYVESNEIGFFTNMEGSQISIICNDPWFTSEDSGVTNLKLSTVEPLFEFPVSFVPYDGTIEFSRKKTIVTGKIPYYGDIETGFTMRIKCMSATGNITISNMDTLENLVVDSSAINKLTNSPLKTGDIIEITTYTGRKTARLFRNNVYTNAIAAITKNSTWLKLYSGDNNLSAQSQSGRVEVSLDLVVLYEGI